MEPYDYVVVGAGSAGCALARRLSDDPDATVCVLEAGGRDVRPEIHDPAVYFTLWTSEIDWGYRTVPQPGCAGRSLYWPRGKVLGGTSSLNGMVYLRGARQDYDSWAYAGCLGWDWESVRRSFEELEATPEKAGGPLRVGVVPDPNPMSQTFLDACHEVGLPYNESFDSGTLDGAGWNRSTIFSGRRQSSATAFLTPVLDRPNLTVLTDAPALRVVLDGGRATGVVVARGGSSETVRAEREVILAAGAVDSPKLLLLSGIGPARDLEDAGVEVRHDLPGVGRNLLDHMLIGVVYEAARPVPPRYTAITEACAFARSDPRRLSPDVEISFAKETLFAEGRDVPGNCYTIIPGIVRPVSRGFVRLRSADPSEPPEIDPRHLAEEADVQGLLDGIRLAREIGAAAALRGWRRREVVPGPRATGDAELREFVRTVATTWFHPVGSCRMGLAGDAVVDPRLRVRGLEGLRVADASVMPDIVSVNTNAASMMIGWKAAELVRGGA